MSEPTTEDLLEQMTIALRQLADGHRDMVKILQGVQQWCQLMDARVRELERGNGKAPLSADGST